MLGKEALRELFVVWVSFGRPVEGVPHAGEPERKLHMAVAVNLKFRIHAAEIDNSEEIEFRNSELWR